MPDRHATAGLPGARASEPVTLVDIADETYVRVEPGVLAPLVADPRSWRRWWPDLQVVVSRDRGVRGQQWDVSGALRGTMEVWLEAVAGGTVVHWYLRADPPAGVARTRPGRLRRDRDRRVRRWKADMFGLKDRLEAGADLKDLSLPAEST